MRSLRIAFGLCLVLVVSSCGHDGDDDGGAADAGSGTRDGGATSDDGGPTETDGGSAADAATPDDGGGGDAGTIDVDGGAGGGGHRGPVLFFEPFEDTDFGSRGWYDGPSGNLSDVEHIAGSTRSFECRYRAGQRSCAGGRPGRHMFPEQQAVHLSYWVKYSAGWVGSGRPYHPHEFHFITNQDGRFVGPAYTRLTTYIEQVGGFARLALQDAANVDPACILRNDDSFVGCGGDFGSYAFTEMRSSQSCNGLMGDVDERDCYSLGGGRWYSSRGWSTAFRVFRDERGIYDQNEWHFVEAYFRLNTVAGGVGQVDGAIRYWFDGAVVISSDRVLMRTGQHPDMAFDQFLIAPYIGDGSPMDQTMWIDDLTVAAGLTP